MIDGLSPVRTSMLVCLCTQRRDDDSENKRQHLHLLFLRVSEFCDRPVLLRSNHLHRHGNAFTRYLDCA